MADPLEERLRTALAEQYRVERKIGDGGMAAVYLAEELEPRRQVAIKVLKPEVAAVLGHERFLAEIEIASRLNHSYILALLHSGVVDGQSYYVMPYEQESLRDRLKRQQQLPIEDAIRIAREVSEALEHAHRQEVVHRDIKPENIMFKGEHVAVADFGIASAAWALGGKKLTGTGVTLGTSAYMSPEQTLAEELDGRSDVYSLGCVLYEMLAGQAPYTGPNAMTVEAQHRSSPIPDVTQLRPSVPEGILGALQKSLAKNRADRFESASGFAAALERGASEQSSVTPPSPKLVPAWLKSIAGVVLVVGVVALAAKWIIDQRRPPEPLQHTVVERILIAPFENLGLAGDEYFAAGITEENTSRLASLRGIGVIAPASAKQYGNASVSIARIGDELDVGYILKGTVRWEKGGDSNNVRVSTRLIRVSDATHVWAEQYDAALEEVFRVQSEIAEAVARALNVALRESDRNHLQKAPTNSLEAYDFYLRGISYLYRSYQEDDFAAAINMFEQALRFDPEFAIAYAKLSLAHARIYWWHDHSPERLRLAKVAVDRALQLSPMLAEGHHALGIYFYWGSRDYERALVQFKLAQKQLPGDGSIVDAIAGVTRRSGNLQEGLEHFLRAFELNPRSSTLAVEIAITYGMLGNPDKAESYCDRAIAMSPDLVIGYVEKAYIAMMQDEDGERSREILRTATQYMEPTIILEWLGELTYRPLLRVASSEFKHDIDRVALDDWKGHILKADALRIAEVDGRATSNYDSALVRLQLLALTSPEAGTLHSSIALAYAGLGLWERAIEEARKGVELLPVSRDAVYGPWVLVTLAEVLVRAGEHSAALEQLEYLMSVPSEISAGVLRADPVWGPLHHEPRFKRLLEG